VHVLGMNSPEHISEGMMLFVECALAGICMGCHGACNDGASVDACGLDSQSVIFLWQYVMLLFPREGVIIVASPVHGGVGAMGAQYGDVGATNVAHRGCGPRDWEGVFSDLPRVVT